MSSLKSFLIVLALVVAIATPAEAEVVKTTFKLKDRSYISSFFNVDECSVMVTTVRFADFAVKFNGETEDPPPSAFVEFDYQNICTTPGTTEQLIMNGFVDQPQFSATGNLGSATLFAVVPVSTDPDFGPQPQRHTTVTVQISFTADGPIVTVEDKFKSKDGGVKYKSFFENQSRPGVSTGTVSGTLPLDSGDLFVNLTDFPSQTAQLGRNTFGEVTITKTVP